MDAEAIVWQTYGVDGRLIRIERDPLGQWLVTCADGVERRGVDLAETMTAASAAMIEAELADS